MQERSIVESIEDNRSIPVPGAAASGRHVAERYGRAGRELSSFELAGREKAEGFGVRGPERKQRAFRAGQLACDEGIEGTDPEGNPPGRSRERDHAASRPRRSANAVFAGAKVICQRTGRATARSGTKRK